MRRFPIVLGVTVAGLSGLLVYHTSSGTGQLAPSASSVPPTTVPPKGGGSPQPTTGSTSPSSTSAPPTTASPHTASPTSATGSTEQYGYGELAVQVTTAGTTITDVKVALLRTADTYSQQLAGQVVPNLRQEVLTAQSAHIASVSGATYTSQAYADSVQSALDKLRS